jgi:hypothetical protein
MAALSVLALWVCTLCMAYFIADDMVASSNSGSEKFMSFHEV